MTADNNTCGINGVVLAVLAPVAFGKMLIYAFHNGTAVWKL